MRKLAVRSSDSARQIKEILEYFKNSTIEKVVITNTLPLPPEKMFDKVVVLSVAGLIADALDAVFEDTSVSDIFAGQHLS